MDKVMAKAIHADVMIANGKFYFVDRIDWDDQIIYCTDLEGSQYIIDHSLVALSDSVKFYNMEEIK